MVRLLFHTCSIVWQQKQKKNKKNSDTENSAVLKLLYMNAERVGELQTDKVGQATY